MNPPRYPLNSPDPFQIWQVTQNPELRWHEVPGGDALASLLALHPEDGYLRDIFSLKVKEQAAKAMVSGNPFHGSYPPAGSLVFRQGMVPLAFLPTGDVLSIPAEAVCRNMLLVGPTGSGKTTLLRWIITALSRAGVSVIAFDRKGDLLDCPALHDRVVPLRWDEIRLNPLQMPTGMSVAGFINTFVELLGRHASLEASRRLALESLHELFGKAQGGTAPTLKEWIQRLDKIPGHALSRLGQYREALMYALKQLTYSLGDVVSCVASTFMKEVLEHPCVTVINTSTLAPDIASFLASLMVNSAYESRGSGFTRRIAFVLDDALPLVSEEGASRRDSPALSTWWLMARSRGLGFVVSCQNFSAVSGIVKNNTDCLVCCGSYGRDAEELSRYLGLTREQASTLPMLGRGSVIAIARSVFPSALYGTVPPIQEARMSEDLRMAKASAFMAGIVVTKDEPVVVQGQGGLSAIALKILTKAALEPGCLLMKMYEDLGVTAEVGGRAIRELTAEKMAIVRDLVRKRRGGTPYALEVLEVGLVELAKRGIAPAEKILPRGGWKHDVYARQLKRRLERLGHRHWFEKTLGARCFDCVYQHGDELIAVEICLTGAAERHAEEGFRGAQIPGIARVLLAVELKKLIEPIKRALLKLDPMGRFQDKVKVIRIAEFHD